MKIFYAVFLALAGTVTVTCVHGQVTMSAQLRTRAELRDGQGAPAVADTAAAFFITQRTRLNVGYAGYRFSVFTSLQDVRVWGQDASTINRTQPQAHNGLMIHEAWAQVSLLDTGSRIKEFVLKAGRQELIYDDSRLLGNLDWLQQARRHDAVLLEFGHKGLTAHLGAAFNQNAERKANTIYNGIPTGYPAGTNGIGTMYKSMQFLYAAYKLPASTVSILVFKDDFSRFHFDEADTQQRRPVFGSGVWSRYTTGAHFTGAISRNLTVTADAFYQAGRYREGTALNEYFFSLSAMYGMTNHLSVGPGFDLTSGNNGSDHARRHQRFDPLYGTPHKFWGYMDYFYAGDDFGANGLLDVYVRSRIALRDNVAVTLDAHRFSLPDAVTDEHGRTLGKSLGMEVDLTGSLALTRAITAEGGYSFMHMSGTMMSGAVKNVPGGSRMAQWAWLMISIKPSFMHEKTAGK